MRNKFLLAFITLLSSISTYAQEDVDLDLAPFYKLQDKNMLNHLDLSLSAGTTGIGFDLAMPITDLFQVRVGGSFVPKFKYKMNFEIQIGQDNPSKYVQQQRFEKLSSLLEGFMGSKFTNEVYMYGEPNLNNAKFLIDIFPFKNKKWHFTTGFFWGSSTVANGYNTLETSTMLVGVNMYNTMYTKAEANVELMNYNGASFRIPDEINKKILSYGTMFCQLGYYSHDVYAEEDIYYDHDVYDYNTYQVIHYGPNAEDGTKGDLKYAKGDLIHKKGDPYRMVPNEQNIVTVTAKANSFKPYVGFGYGGPITKDGKTSLSFDCGAMFWGGSPKLITQDGTDLINDVYDVAGKVGNYIKVAKCLKVYPVISVRVTQRIF